MNVAPPEVNASFLTTVLAIDPGSSSGAYVHGTGGALIPASNSRIIDIGNMPGDVVSLWRLIQLYAGCAFVVENVGGARPGNSSKSARTFAAHRGHIDMGCVAAGVPWILRPVPRQWLTGLFGEEYPKGDELKCARKQFVYDKMKLRWPGVNFSKRQADAVAIYTWYVDKKLPNGG